MGKKSSKPVILIIDDMEIDREILKRQLGDEYEYLEAEGGREAIDIISSSYEDINIILLDIFMPDADGYAVLEYMNREGIIDEIPVIVVSSDNEFGDIDRAFALGVHDYISKNTSYNIIRNRIRNVIGYFSSYIKKMQMAQEKIRELSNTQNNVGGIDALTGCYDLDSFIFDAEFHLKENLDKHYVLVYFDVNNLTYINNAFGYEVGNEILKIIGKDAIDSIRNDEVVGRVSGDRFVMFLESDPQKKRAESIISRIRNDINRYLMEKRCNYKIVLVGGIYRITKEDIASFGVSVLVDRVTIAHKEAKKRLSLSLVEYSSEMIDRQNRENEILSSLDSAMEKGEIEIWLQPQINCTNNHIIGAEVLCRWNSASMGFVSPGEFIPILEANGRVSELDKYVWEKTCQLLRKWKDRGREEIIPLSINVSRFDIVDIDIDRYFTELIRKYDLSPDLLRIEITESAYMDEPEQLIKCVKCLKEAGFLVEMDDFGSGFSSLNMLKEVPVDVLKLDLRFFRSNGEEKHSGGTIISAVVRMAKAIGLRVIAEGVETEEQCMGLKNMGCTIIQGFYYSRPLPVDEFERYAANIKVESLKENVFDKEIIHIHELMDSGSNSAYVFDHYIGSAAIIELSGDRMEVLRINDRFFEAMGDYEQTGLKYVSSGLAMVQDKDKEDVLNTIKRAAETGFAEIETYLPDTKQWIKISYRLIVKGSSSSYLCCEAVNTTEKHIMGAHYQKLMTDGNDTIKNIPGGIFKYEADGDQRFFYISSSMLWLLGYDSQNEFMKKFNGRFPDMIYEEDRDRVLREIDSQITKDNCIDYCEYRVERADGSLMWVQDYGHLVEDEHGKKWFYVIISEAGRN